MLREYRPYIIAGAITLVGLLLAILTAYPLESPDVALDRQIEEKVEAARQMLNSYDPMGSSLLMLLSKPAPQEQPTESSTEPAPDMERENPFEADLQQQQRALSQADQRFAELGGKRGTGMGGDPAADLRTGLERNEALIEKALALVQQAVAMGSGDGTVTGSAHLEATRLAAILLYHQGDLLRRQAALRRAAADDQRLQFEQTHARWNETKTQIVAVQNELTQGARMELVTLAEDGPPETGKPAATRPASVEPLPPISDQVQRLQAQADGARKQIDESRSDLARLEGIVKDLQERLASATQRADAAYKRMFELESKGIEPADPQSLPTFVTEYQQASREFRESSLEATVLDNGSLRNARIGTQDENQTLRAPLVPRHGDQPIEPQIGLRVRQRELKAAEIRLSKQTEWLKQIEEQIVELGRRHKDASERLAKLQEERQAHVKTATEELKAMMVPLIEAEGLESRALDILTGNGPAAVTRARSAAQQRMRRARDLNMDNAEKPDRRLTLMAGDKFTSGHVAALAGDMAYVQALIQAQRRDGYARQAETLAQVTQMGIAAQQLLPEGVETDAVAPGMLDALAARTAADEALAQARQAAEHAIQVYQEDANSDLNDLWVLHANIAAIDYLLATLATDPAQAKTYRMQAYKIYERSIRDRRDRPDAKIYEPIMQRLTQK